MKRHVLTLALLVAIASPTLAQRGEHRSMKWLDEPTLAAARTLVTSLGEWARTDVLPEARAWKAELDNSLSPADLAKLNDLRRQAASLRERSKANAKTMREAWKSEDYDALKSARAAKKSLAEERRAIIEELKPIAEAGRVTLEAIRERAHPKLRTWTDEARAIGEKWYEEHKETISPVAAHAIGGVMRHRGNLFAMLEPKLRTKAAVARFMLWDGEDFTRGVEAMMQNGSVEGLQDMSIE